MADYANKVSFIGMIADEVCFNFVSFCSTFTKPSILTFSPLFLPHLPPHHPYLLSRALQTQDTITGFLLAGAGHRDKKSGSNFLIVDPEKTPKEKIVEYFKALTARKDISLILINQHIAELIRPTLELHTAAIPAVLEIPSKEHPYDEAKDPLMRRVKQLLGNPDD